MPVSVTAACLVGIEAMLVHVEVDVSNGLPGLHIVGLPDKAVRESSERVRAAIRNSGFDYPYRRITVNLAPADVPKAGPAFDLAVAAGILAATRQIPAASLSRLLLLGELALDGQIRPVRGVLSAGLAARHAGLHQLVVAAANEAEAAASGCTSVGFGHLMDLVEWLRKGGKHKPTASRNEKDELQRLNNDGTRAEMQWDEILGQPLAKRALIIAAAGGHNVLLIGPPGSGKTLLAQSLPGILTQMSEREALETTAIHSVAGLLPPRQTLLRERPFRAPHHTISPAGLLGTAYAPGEVSLAHNGVLFLDEWPEFRRDTKEALRQPLEQGRIALQRSGRQFLLPAVCTLVAACNPCACGYWGDQARDCRCSVSRLKTYRRRLSGPLLDRIDLHVLVERVDWHSLAKSGESAAEARSLVAMARERQKKRQAESGVATNARLEVAGVRQLRTTPEAKELLGLAYDRLGLSLRGHDRVLKVARTIADLAGDDEINAAHVGEAIQFRSLDRELDVALDGA